MTIDDEIDFIGNGDLEKNIKTMLIYIPIVEKNKVDFLYSKPDDKEIKIKVHDKILIEEIDVGIHNQFYLMYDAL